MDSSQTALSIILVIGSILTFVFVMRYIRKATIRIEDAIFWIIFCIVLVLISVFPSIPIKISAILKFQSPINLVYLIMIFILMINQFYMSLKISRLIIKQKELVQRIGVDTAKTAFKDKDDI